MSNKKPNKEKIKIKEFEKVEVIPDKEVIQPQLQDGGWKPDPTKWEYCGVVTKGEVWFFDED